MKFKFCADGDCPFWALAALHALSSLQVSLFKSLLEHVIDDKPDDGIMEILKDTSLSSREECSRAAAVMRWVLKQCWRNACQGSQLTQDLLALGVPPTHAAALADAAEEGRDDYLASARDKHFTVNKLTNASITAGPEGTVDTLTLRLVSTDVTGQQTKTDLLIERSQAQMLVDELKDVAAKMDKIIKSSKP